MAQMKLIYERAWSFHNTTGINFDDLVDEAMEAYVTGLKEYRPEYGVKETTYIYKVITNSLTQYCRELAKFPTTHFDNEDEASCFSYMPNFDQLLGKKPVLNGFDPYVKELIEVVLDNQQVFEDNARENRAKLKKLLRSKNWSHSKIAVSFLLIKKLLKNVPVSELFSW